MRHVHLRHFLPGHRVGLSAAFCCATLAMGQQPSGEPTAVDVRPGGTGGGSDGPGLGLDWHTVDGGGATYLTAGVFQLGATAGQPDAGLMTGGAFTLGGGFWPGLASSAACYANCDGSTGVPRLTANDFQCFVNAYAGGAPYANCDGSTGTPALTANDFQCFVNAFAGGCS